MHDLIWLVGWALYRERLEETLSGSNMCVCGERENGWNFKHDFFQKENNVGMVDIVLNSTIVHITSNFAVGIDMVVPSYST